MKQNASRRGRPRTARRLRRLLDEVQGINLADLIRALDPREISRLSPAPIESSGPPSPTSTSGTVSMEARVLRRFARRLDFNVASAAISPTWKPYLRILNMAKKPGESTGKSRAILAAKILRDPKASKEAKTAAASALTQRPVTHKVNITQRQADLAVRFARKV